MLSPLMFNQDLAPTTEDVNIISKYLNKSQELKNESTRNQKVYFTGASSVYIGEEPSMRTKAKHK